jgi:hypothetical protein
MLVLLSIGLVKGRISSSNLATGTDMCLPSDMTT